MTLDCSRIVSIDGCEAYAVLFTQLCPPALPIEVPCPVIDITITQTSSRITYVNYDVLRQFSDIIHEYLLVNDVIMMYLCDNSEIMRRKQDISPQAYRSSLFSALARRKKDQNIVREDIKLIDRSTGSEVDYFASVFAKKNRHSAVIALSKAITDMEK